MIITQRNEIADYWSGTPFLGQQIFPETMARNRVQAYRNYLRILPSLEPSPQEKSNDPLWHSPDLLNHLQKKSKELVVQTGVSSLDESSVRTRAHTKASSYIPLKPDKYAIRFYAIVGWASLYIHSLWDNGSGLMSELSPGERYFFAVANIEDIEFDADAAYSVWVSMVGHQTKILRSKDTKQRLIVCDNFYTRNVFAKALLAFTDGNIRLLGTVRSHYLGKWNRVEVAKSKERIEAI
ncbi:hypothetical protein PHMEG_00027404 [Phytophthora megakarya]|uniref:PiggyBac transposable element-derived protein domain-containing protein n=1 Tax=Phytophthora megakarya TaxID=4795 RepID=A0A225V8M7_9STRA|nr:hypothetical protein PHMEG_00027404 [Phytophthora megakarya]